MSAHTQKKTKAFGKTEYKQEDGMAKIFVEFANFTKMCNIFLHLLVEL